MNTYRQTERPRPSLSKQPAWLEHARWLWAKGSGPVRGLQLFLAVVLSLLHAGALVAVTGGCSQVGLQVQAQTASVVATAANAALPILVERYRSEGVEVIMAVKQRGGTAQEARDELQGVKDRWAPIWKAWKGLRIAQDVWADALEGGASVDAAAAAMKDAYCELLAVWPESVPAIPVAPLKCPGGAI